MRNKRFKREISYKEYIKRKLNYDLKEVGGFLSKYIINQDIDESISQGTYNNFPGYCYQRFAKHPSLHNRQNLLI